MLYVLETSVGLHRQDGLTDCASGAVLDLVSPDIAPPLVERFGRKMKMGYPALLYADVG